jgi:hypothetical protein
MLKHVARSLFAGAVVYVTVVACSSSDQPQTLTAAGLDDDGGFGGAAQEGDSAKLQEQDGGILDALINPVTDARAADAPAATSGSRLKGRWQVGADGSRQFIGWYDSERKEECQYMLASDGKMRCLPMASAHTIQPSASSYQDAECTKLGVMNPPCNPRYFAINKTSELCGKTAVQIYNVGASFQVAGTMYQKAGGQCVKFPVTGAATISVLGDEVPASAFVAADVQIQ